MQSFPRLQTAEEPDWWLGGAIYLCVARAPTWIRRRVESVSFLDARSMRRRVSLDFEIPDESVSPGRPPPAIPLALLEKRPLVNFDLRDETGASLTVLTKEENGFAAWSALARIAQHEAHVVFGEKKTLPPEILSDLRRVAGSSGLRALDALQHLGGDVDPDLRTALQSSPFFMDFANSLAQAFLLLTPTDDPPGTARIAKFSYAQPLEFPPETRWQRFAGQVGIQAAEYGFRIPAIGESESYHFEFACPPGLAIAAAELVVFEDSPEGHDEDAPEGVADEFEVDAYPAQLVGSLAHVYVSGKSAEFVGIARVWLTFPTEGLLRAGLAVGALGAGIFLFFLWGDRIERIEGNAPAALLLAIPSLVAAFLVRPGEHGMATNLLTGLRAEVAAAGATAYVGAMVVIGGIEGVALINTWRILAIASAVCFLALVASLVGRTPSGLMSEEE